MPTNRLELDTDPWRGLPARVADLIEVEVDFINRSRLTPEQAGDINTSALDIAQVMRDKVSALS